MFFIVRIFWCLFLAGCSFTPLLDSPHVNGDLVKVSVISERLGQQLRNMLQDYFPGTTPQYQLKINLSSKQDSLMIEKDATTRRYQLRLKADFSLDPIGKSGRTYHSTVETLGSYNILNINNPIYGSADFSNVIAEEAAKERALAIIAQRIRWQVCKWLSQEHEAVSR